MDAIRTAGGNPVLVTPMYRRRFIGNYVVDTFGDYPEAVRRVAAEKGVPSIDLHAMSARLLAALGPDQSRLVVVHFPAGAYGSEQAVRDDTHFSPYGATSSRVASSKASGEKCPRSPPASRPTPPRFTRPARRSQRLCSPGLPAAPRSPHPRR